MSAVPFRLSLGTPKTCGSISLIFQHCLYGLHAFDLDRSRSLWEARPK